MSDKPAIDMDLTGTKARIEKLDGVVHLVLDDGTTRVRFRLPSPTEEPFPYQLVEALGWRIVRRAPDVRWLAMDYLEQTAT